MKFLFRLCTLWLTFWIPGQISPNTPPLPQVSLNQPLACNCTITQGNNTYPINSIIGNENSISFYDYGNPNGSNANTGFEISETLILFLYEDSNTGIISLFLIADIYSDGTGGSLEFEFNCAPAGSFIALQDDFGEFFGSPPLFTGDWNWSGPSTDGGIIENVGCNTNMSLDLLISSGINSVVWISGSIASPVLIPLATSGESITINCGGGGACCPIGFDTDIDVTNAGCATTANGSITVSPQDGVPPYNYQWSNGGDMAINNDLLPGSYTVTITDDNGCTEQHAVTVGFSGTPPVAVPAAMYVCSDDPTAEFDLTTLDDIVNGTSSFDVVWFENADMTGLINMPDIFFSGETTVYAVVDNGSCYSLPVPVELTINPIPISFPAEIETCEEINGGAHFNLTSVDHIVNGGSGMEVFWFLSNNYANPVLFPEDLWSPPQAVYAAVYDGFCLSLTSPVELIIIPAPEALPAEMQVCANEFGEGLFDLTLLDTEVTTGPGNVAYYYDSGLFELISNPSAFWSPSTIIYAEVEENFCFSDPVAITLTAEPLPVANSFTIDECSTGGSTAVLDLGAFDNAVSNGGGDVSWFEDAALTDPINNPGSFLTSSTTVYAIVDNGTCVSETAAIVLNVIPGPTGMSTTIETCAEITGDGIFNLPAAESIISGGTGMVLWYQDAAGTMIISNPAAYQSVAGTIYAQINNGGCVSPLIPITLSIITSVTASPAALMLCDDGMGTALFNLGDADANVSGGSGTVSWFTDAAGLTPVATPNAFQSPTNTVYARVSAGSCVSSIVPVTLTVLPTPAAQPAGVNLCGDLKGEIVFDLTLLDPSVGAGMGNVLWFADTLMTIPILNPASFATSGITVYAAVTNGTCISSSVPVELNVSAAPTATPILLDLCISVDNDTLFINLTQYNGLINPSLMINWFSDPAGDVPINDPFQYPGTATGQLYASATDGICTSAIVTIDLLLNTIPFSNSISLQRCGDANGQTLIDLVSFDPVISDNTGIVSWYAASDLTVPVLNPGNVLTGDTILYALVTNGSCVSPIAELVIDVVDELIAQPVTLEVCVIDQDTAEIDLNDYTFQIGAGAGEVFWFTDAGAADTITNTSAYITNGQPVFASVNADGCVSDIIINPIVFTFAETPVLVSCAEEAIDSLSFAWNGNAASYEIQYSINGQGYTDPVQNTSEIFGLGDLSQGDEVSLIVTATFNAVCNIALSDTISCALMNCPPAVITIEDVDWLCSSDPPISLSASIEGINGTPQIIWTGESIIDPSGIFDPSISSAGVPEAFVTIEVSGCIYTDSINFVVFENPVASFVLEGNPCVDSSLTLKFNGEAFFSAIPDWEFDGAEAMQIPFSFDHFLQWDEPGSYVLSLQLDYKGCLSDVFEYPVEIHPSPDQVVLTCIEEDYFEVEVGWEPVPGAVSYMAFTNSGKGTLSGTTYRITELEDNASVQIIVEAIGESGCGVTRDSITCITKDFIPPKIFIPNTFSPDRDGINDVIMIETNEKITDVLLFRVFDRWGDMIFEEIDFKPNDPSHAWDGSFDGKPVNPGVFLYWVEVVTDEGDSIVITGDITVIK